METGLKPMRTGVNFCGLSKQYSNWPPTNGADKPQLIPRKRTCSKDSVTRWSSDAPATGSSSHASIDVTRALERTKMMNELKLGRLCYLFPPETI
jgi:hypothetical protein